MDKMKIGLLALLLMIGLGLAGAFAFGAFDSDDSGMMRGDGKNASKLASKHSSSPRTNTGGSGNKHDSDKPDSTPDNNPDEKPDPNNSAEKVSYSLSRPLIIRSGAIRGDALSFHFPERLANGAEVNVRLEGLEYKPTKTEGILGIEYNGPKTTTIDLPLRIVTDGHDDAKGIVSVDVEKDFRVKFDVKFAVSLRGAVYQQGGVEAIEGAKVVLTNGVNEWANEPDNVRPYYIRRDAFQETVTFEINEEGLRDRLTIECGEDGRFTATKIKPGAIDLHALYPNGKEGDEVVALVRDNSNYWDEASAKREDPESDPRKSGEYQSSLGFRAESGSAHDDLLLGLEPVSRLLFTMANPPKGEIAVTYHANEVEKRSGMIGISREIEPSLRVKVGDGGRVVVEGLTRLVKRVTLLPKGYLKYEKVIKVQAGQDLDLGVITFDLGYTLQGFVRDTQGKPVAKARVAVASDMQKAIRLLNTEMSSASEAKDEDGNVTKDSDLQGFPYAESDEKGFYSIGGLNAGELMVKASHSILMAQPMRITIPESPTVKNHDITLSAGGGIKGAMIVSSEMSEIIKNAKGWDKYAAAEEIKEAQPAVPIDDDETKEPEEPERPSTDTSLFGEGTFPTISLMVSKDVAMLGGGLAALIGGDSIATRMVDSTIADEMGDFAFGAIPPGEYELLAQVKDFKTRLARVFVAEAGVSQVTLEFPRPATVRGVVLDADGEPSEGETVILAERLMGSHFSARSGITNEKGEYLIQGVAPRSYVVQLESERERFDQSFIKERTIEVAEGETVEKDIDLSESSGPSIRGVLTINGKPAFDYATLYAGGHSKVSFRREDIDEEGAVAFTNVAPGSYYFGLEGRLAKESDDGSSEYSDVIARLVVHVKESDDEIDISQDFSAGPVLGNVAMPMDIKRSEARVVFHSLSEDPLGADIMKRMVDKIETSCDAQGNFKLLGLIEGSYRVEVLHPKMARVSKVIKHSGDSNLSLALVDLGKTLEVEVTSIIGDTEGMPFLEMSLLDSQGVEIMPQGQPFTMLSPGIKVVYTGLSVGNYSLVVPNSTVEGFTKEISITREETNRVGIVLKVAARIELTILNQEISPQEVGSGDVVWKNLATGATHKSGSFFDAMMAMQQPTKTIVGKGLTPGRWEVSYKLDGYKEFKARYSVEAGKAVKETISLESKDG